MADYNSSLAAEQIESRLVGAVVVNDTQNWTEQQKAQARANIGAGTSDSGLQIRGYFDTYEELVATITNPGVGATYAVGTEEPYEIYIWDSLNNVWRANGFIRGADGTDAEVTTENIVAALGYTPAATDGSNLEDGCVTADKLGSDVKLGVTLPKVWENASPTSNFEAQTISLDLSNYNFISIDFVVSAGASTHVVTGFAAIGSSTYCEEYTTNSGSVNKRNFKPRTNGVTFENGRQDTTQGSEYMIPYIIYGIGGK